MRDRRPSAFSSTDGASFLAPQRRRFGAVSQDWRFEKLATQILQNRNKEQNLPSEKEGRLGCSHRPRQQGRTARLRRGRWRPREAGDSVPGEGRKTFISTLSMAGKQQPMSEGLPPSKQQQHEEALAPLDDQERRAVQKRLMRRNHGSGASATSRSTARDRYNDPAFAGRGPGSSRRSGRGQSYTARSAMTTSRSMMTTARSSSPTGRYHPDPTRRLELRKVRPDCRPRPTRHPRADARARARAHPRPNTHNTRDTAREAADAAAAATSSHSPSPVGFLPTGLATASASSTPSSSLTSLFALLVVCPLAALPLLLCIVSDASPPFDVRLPLLATTPSRHDRRT